MMTHLFQDATFWVAVSTVCFFLFLAVKGAKPIAASLDARTQAIADRLNEAERLKAEAEELLALFKSKNDNAQIEAAALLADAKTRAAQMADKANADLERALQRLKEGAAMRISQAESNAIAAVRNHVIAQTRSLAEKKLAAKPATFSLQGLSRLAR